MPSWKIEMEGDGDTTIKDFAVKFAADHAYVAEVTLGPGEGRDIVSVADYVVSGYGPDPETGGRDRVYLTLLDEDGGVDVDPDDQWVLVDDIWELKIY